MMAFEIRIGKSRCQSVSRQSVIQIASPWANRITTILIMHTTHTLTRTRIFPTLTQSAACSGDRETPSLREIQETGNENSEEVVGGRNWGRDVG